MDYKEYPKSVNNRQCIGPCYPKGKILIHPYSLTKMTDHYNNFCPTYKYTDDAGNKLQIDNCDVSNANPENIKLGMLVPLMSFDCGAFLQIYYNSQ